MTSRESSRQDRKQMLFSPCASCPAKTTPLQQTNCKTIKLLTGASTTWRSLSSTRTKKKHELGTSFNFVNILKIVWILESKHERNCTLFYGFPRVSLLLRKQSAWEFICVWWELLSTVSVGCFNQIWTQKQGPLCLLLSNWVNFYHVQNCIVCILKQVGVMEWFCELWDKFVPSSEKTKQHDEEQSWNKHLVHQRTLFWAGQTWYSKVFL